MRLSEFDFELPDDRIALRPISPRDAAKLLVVGPQGELEDRIVRDLPSLLNPGDAIVLNDTKVIASRLSGVRRREGGEGARVEAQLLERESEHRWRALAKPGKRLAVGDRVSFGASNSACLLGALDATVEAKREDGEIILAFDLSGPDLEMAIAAAGAMPLPPYIASRRAPDERDIADYQTVYAAHDGAVAAPTAGLHFTPRLLSALAARGVRSCRVTLHVGAGTFLPIKVDDIAEHKMHPERGEVSAAVAAGLNETRRKGGRIVAIGTTSLRLIESAVDDRGVIRPFSGDTDIYIAPGRVLRAVDVLMTNFHLPRSSLFILVSAFSGLERMRRAYAHAMHHGYRFYSYGDASLLHRAA